MIKSSLIDQALKIAIEQHENQVDKAEMSMIYHAIRVAKRSTDSVCDTTERLDYERLHAIGLLHDVLEDGVISFDELSRVIDDVQVLQAVKELTRSKDETYREYIERLSSNRMATQVKIADLEDHLEPISGFSLPEPLIARYDDALYYLTLGYWPQK